MSIAEHDVVRDAVSPEKSGETRHKRTIRFTKLRLDGFKSFADRTEIDILPGITGIVGPNGCGKSNLLEALKWALGETSARQMRGEGMDDVIFGGTEKRPPRNVAEVSLILDNRERAVPPQFNDVDTLEVVRRIARGDGTAYKVNGKGARLRDIQILFQDNAAGAKSPAIVSQGRVSALISAKPSERRAVLDEAAGVSGLTSRRHDNEQKLKATEGNLLRSEDSIAQMTEQLVALRRQAKQAQRFREIDTHIRVARAIVLGTKYETACTAEAEARTQHDANEQIVMSEMLRLQQVTNEKQQTSERLEPMRAIRLQKEGQLTLAKAKLSQVEADAQRLARQTDELKRRIGQYTTDLDRDRKLVVEADGSIKKLQDERAALLEAREGEEERYEAAADAADRLRIELDSLEKDYQESHRLHAMENATRISLERQKEDISRRLDTTRRRLQDSEQKLAKIRSEAAYDKTLDDAINDLHAWEDAFQTANAAVSKSEYDLTQEEQSLQSVVQSFNRIEAELAKLNAEHSAITALLQARKVRSPISERLVVAAGWEAAVASAFGTALQAGTLDTDDIHWEPCSESVVSEIVKGATEIGRALKYVSFLETEADLDRLPPLSVGHIAVTRSGAFRRWDGLRGKKASLDVVAEIERIAQRRELELRLSSLTTEQITTRAIRDGLQSSIKLIRSTVESSRLASRSALDAVNKARARLAEVERSGETHRRQAALAEQEASSLREEMQEMIESFETVVQQIFELPEAEHSKEKLDASRIRLDAHRLREKEAQTMCDKLAHEINMRRERLAGFVRDIAQWELRAQDAKTRCDETENRLIEAQGEFEDLIAEQVDPQAALEEARDLVFDIAETIVELESTMKALEEQRIAAEEAERVAHERLTVAREERARLQAAISAGQASVATLLDQITAAFNAEPNALRQIAGYDAEQPWPAIDASEHKLARLEREKDSIGAINFLAEQELADYEKRFGDLEKIRDELRKTIAQLRQAIATIDTEARIRLQEAFSLIDGNFADLFQRLFGGGKAHLRLVGSEDILDAGLEIYASPPGKKLQVLSLLSGGEQALTAMALIFAAFLANPAPICVLDEVDAPLDDANTDKLCRLIEILAQEDKTRFVVVTHNPLMMARTNRLYGVTMMERGISTLSHVDLDKAIRIIST